jgi:ABC-type xylose transport system substrate-binding protein
MLVLWGDPSDGNARFVYDAQLKAMEPYIEKQPGNYQLYKPFMEGWSGENAGFIMNKISRLFGTEPIDVM